MIEKYVYLAGISILLIVPICYILKGISSYLSSLVKENWSPTRNIRQLYASATKAEKIASIFILVLVVVQIGFAGVWSVYMDQTNIGVVVAACVAVFVLFVIIITASGLILNTLLSYIYQVKEMKIGVKLLLVLMHGVFYLFFCLFSRHVIGYEPILCWLSNYIMLILCLWCLIDILVFNYRVLDVNNNVQKLKFVSFMFGIIVFTATILVDVTRIGWNDSFPAIHSIFDSFYYVVITFSTIGYGDIRPENVWAKLDACLIAVSSIVFLSAFFNIFMSRTQDQ